MNPAPRIVLLIIVSPVIAYGIAIYGIIFLGVVLVIYIYYMIRTNRADRIEKP